MAQQALPSVKRVMIDKANSAIVVIVSAACFIVVFCLVASYTLVGQLNYQNKVISHKKKALTQIKADIGSVGKLVNSYEAFVSTGQNIIGGDPTGNGDKDGDNAQIVLDALPSQYDFPALATSLEKIATSQNVQIQSITGTDDELNQSAGSSAAPQAVPIPFTLSVSGDYQSLQNVINAFEHSVRPFQVQQLKFTGGETNMTLAITAQTYYQPAKSLNIRKEVVH